MLGYNEYLWKVLEMFFSDQKLQTTWKSELFQYEAPLPDTYRNVLMLSKEMHAGWNNGYFALRSFNAIIRWANRSEERSTSKIKYQDKETDFDRIGAAVQNSPKFRLSYYGVLLSLRFLFLTNRFICGIYKEFLASNGRPSPLIRGNELSTGPRILSLKDLTSPLSTIQEYQLCIHIILLQTHTTDIDPTTVIYYEMGTADLVIAAVSMGITVLGSHVRVPATMRLH
ncbi:hypothetical protein F5884DRAFT_755445 [Xylogone sp. PMI_703]|nr:hypothetical protein F5884DRAFT_755445 [Xylogone sp. PMI_703]